MRRLNKVFSEAFFPLILVFLVGFLVSRNFASGMWLSGWDNLHPEFNFPLNISRSLSATWQEYQGVGVLGGMGHAADLPRQLILWGLSLAIPTNLLRYLWTFVMLFIGPLGVYFLTKFLIDEKKIFERNMAGLFASLFYLLNLATVQTFFVPFETFTSFFGFFPWLLFIALKYLKIDSKRNLIYLFITSFLATSAFYVQTLFIVYLIFIAVFCLSIIFSEKIKGLFKSVKLGGIIFAANAFWLLPVIYFGITSSHIPALSKINSIATPETQAMNQARGTLGDIAILRGYWFDYYDFRADGTFDYLYKDWINYFDNKEVGYAGYFLFTIAIIGLLSAVLSKKVKLGFSFPILLFVGFTMLGAGNPPFGFLYRFLSEKLPLFADVFRNAFTKWASAQALVYSLGVGFSVFFLLRALGGLKIILASSLLIPVLLSIFIVTMPVFEGKLFYDRVRTKIPNEYFELIDYLKDKPVDARIAYLPSYTFWGWNYYTWGYGGSGFLWYGIKQPILDRAFDVWSPNNESFYNELNYAISSGDGAKFKNILEKYRVKYLLLDSSIINSSGKNSSLVLFPGYNVIARFGFLTLYDTGISLGQDFVDSPGSFTKANSDSRYSIIDHVFEKYGNYVNDQSGVGFPFANLDRRGDVGISLESGGSRLVLENRKSKAKVILPAKDATLETFFPDQGYKDAKNCDLKKKGSVEKTRLGKDGNVYSAKGGGVSCDYFYYPQLVYNQSYLLRMAGENKAGRSLKIYLQNIKTGNIDMQELLAPGSFDEFFFVPPREEEAKDGEPGGYTLNVETRSFGNVSSENIIRNIGFYPIDYSFLSSIYTGAGKIDTVRNGLKINKVEKFGTWFYKVQTSESGLLVLDQGYEPGWIAIPAFNFQPFEHVKINSWENGFIVNNTKTVFIVYWPQILEYLGFLLIPVTLFGLLLTKKGSK